MADPTYAHGAFELLRPHCVRLTMEQTLPNVESLRSQISAMEVSALQGLLEYVLFPLRFSLKTSTSKKPAFVQAVLECISYLLSCTCVKSSDTLHELFNELCCCLPPDPLKRVPEELKLGVASALRSLLCSSSRDVLPVLYKPSTLPELGFAITMLLRLAELEKSREIRLEALNCLEALSLPDLKISVGDLLASFLPGVCTVLTRIICGDPKQGYRVTTAAVKLWAGIVSKVLSDEDLAKVPEKKPVVIGVSERVSELMIHRDKSWVKHTASRLLVHLEKITQHCTADPHWKVRLALVNLGHLLLTRCWNSLEETTGNLLKILVGHMSDDRPEVKARAMEALQEVTKDGPSSRCLGEVLSENLHSLAVTLPRLLSSQDDQGKLHTLALLLGYLQLLGPRLTHTLHSSAHLQRLSAALLQTLELDFCSVKVVEERTPSSACPLEQSTTDGAQQKSFRFFRDPRVLAFIQRVCRLLGYYGDFRLLTDHFLGMYRAHRLPAVLVLNQLVLGAAGIEVEALDGGSRAMNAEELLDVVRPLLEEYIDPANWHLHTCQNSEELGGRLALLHLGTPARPSLSDMSANAWKLCLQLEGIACFAQALGQSFHSLLITALYPLLEKAGDPSLMVSRAALLALSNVSQACGYKDVNQLIELNADYLESEISAGLRLLHQRHGGAACVLHAVLENCGPNLLPLLGELIQDLLPALDQSQDEAAKILLPVLNSLLAYIGKWFPPENVIVAEEPVNDLEHAGSLANEMQEFLRNHIEGQRVARGDVLEEECTDVEPPPETSDSEQKPPMATHIKISKEVAEKCTHFLSHGDPQIRIQALDALRLSLKALQAEENVLLPLAHKIWPCLVKRLLQDEPLILLRAFQVLVSLTVSCKDFLRQRICKDALPAFLNSLRSQAAISSRDGPVYSHTQGFKLQLALLDGLGTLCVSMELGDSDLMEVVDSCMLYLSARQPKKLQDAAVRTLLTLAKMDPDLVWLHLHEWQTPPAAPHSSLAKLEWRVRAHDEYTHNVLKLLQKM
ncbi:TELO2-interacting protein 1 homolog [Spea bombifrons]|uniref:TELO2-interacting protein 1 homolog n=1 Tax=Spea bombifrons TaxID=233779 RepID=UPI00234BD693|nr:TELO2-interacting protein 1 homolog [Spea bombifrons]